MSRRRRHSPVPHTRLHERCFFFRPFFSFTTLTTHNLNVTHPHQPATTQKPHWVQYCTKAHPLVTPPFLFHLTLSPPWRTTHTRTRPPEASDTNGPPRWGYCCSVWTACRRYRATCAMPTRPPVVCHPFFLLVAYCPQALPNTPKYFDARSYAGVQTNIRAPSMTLFFFSAKT